MSLFEVTLWLFGFIVGYVIALPFVNWLIPRWMKGCTKALNRLEQRWRRDRESEPR